LSGEHNPSYPVNRQRESQRAKAAHRAAFVFCAPSCARHAALLCLALAGGWGTAAHAAGSGPLALGSNVIGTCKVTTPPGTLNFGTINPSGAANVAATTTFVMKCTKGTISTAATDDGGSHSFAGGKRMQHSATAGAFLPYSIVYIGSAGFTGQGFGAAAGNQTVTVSGTITPAQFQTALVTTGAQTYTDIVTITVNP
jgi:spore coat protein U-like protein